MRYIASRNSTVFSTEKKDSRVRVLKIFFGLIFGVVIVRLFLFMVIEHGLYTTLASGSQEMYAKLIPQRGEIFMQDSRTDEEYPLALNKDVFVMFADTRQIQNEEAAKFISDQLTPIFGYTESDIARIMPILTKKDDPYEPIEQKVDEKIVEQVRALNLPGIGFARQPHRYYPEDQLAASIVGFVGKDDQENLVGKYGIEGYWNKELAGSGGFLGGARSAKGRWIPLAGRLFQPAVDGVDVVLTIDRTLQFKACERLREGMKEYKATSASLVIMDPKTGAIRAMCSLSDFNPNVYNEVKDIGAYNNSTIFTPYEPGSIFKPLIMSAALNESAVSPTGNFHDQGARTGICLTPIKNAGEKVYDDQTIAQILEHSINTGMVYVAEKLGKKKMVEYIETFGFGLKTGIEMDSEAPGTIESLYQNKGEKLDCYAATASFGQGFTVTPLQITSAFAALANGGTLMKPYIVEEIRHSDGRIDTMRPKEIRRVLARRSASLVAGMLVKTVDKGYGGRAQVKGYYVAGKTGTAQIPGPGGYTQETNHSFVGFAPVDDPKFVMLVKFEKPERVYAEVTAAPVFSDIAKFILNYYQISPAR